MVSSGCRQAFPLSPSLLFFALAIEPLAKYFRSSTELSGIAISSKEQHIFLYADDVLLCLKDPVISAPIVLHFVLQYTKVSDYKINFVLILILLKFQSLFLVCSN